MNGVEQVYIPQLKVVNQPLDVRIHYVHLVRKIIKSSVDTATDYDSDTVLAYLSIQK